MEPSLAGHPGLGWERCRELLAKNSALLPYMRPLRATAYVAIYWAMVLNGAQWYLTSLHFSSLLMIPKPAKEAFLCTY